MTVHKAHAMQVDEVTEVSTFMHADELCRSL